MKKDREKFNKIIKRILLIPYFMYQIPLNLICYLMMKKEHIYFDGGFKEYIRINIDSVKDDWRNI